MHFVSRLFLVFHLLFVPLQYEIDKNKEYGKKQESTEGQRANPS